MKQTAVEWLIQQICGDHTKQWQKEIEQAKAMEKEEKLKNQLFRGKVSEIIGWSKVIELMKECNETFNKPINNKG